MAENESPDSGSSGSTAILVAIIVAILMLGGGFALSYYVLPTQIAKELAKAIKVKTSDGEDVVESDKLKKGEQKEGAKVVSEFTIPDLLVNVAGTRGSRFLKASVFFEADQSVLSQLEDNRAKITDIVSQTLAAKSIDELSSSDARGKLRSELLSTINPLIVTKGEVTNIYFPEFIIQ